MFGVINLLLVLMAHLDSFNQVIGAGLSTVHRSRSVLPSATRMGPSGCSTCLSLPLLGSGAPTTEEERLCAEQEGPGALRGELDPV